MSACKHGREVWVGNECGDCESGPEIDHHPATGREMTAEDLTRLPGGGQVVDNWGVVWTKIDHEIYTVWTSDIEPVPGLSNAALWQLCRPLTLRPITEWDCNQQVPS